MIIAEIAQAHDGSLGLLHSYIDVLSKTGVDAIKFQTHIAEAESSIHEPFRVKFSYADATRYDYWKRMQFTLEQWMGIKQHCDACGLEFMSSPFSNAAVDLLEKVGIKRYKIGSGEVTNFLLLEKIANTGKPVIISSGMSNLSELDAAIALLQSRSIEVSVLQCTTAYPTKAEDWGLNVIQLFKDRYKIPVGFSDHSGDIFAGLAATALGAEILEFHAVFNKEMFGPDAKASIEIQDITKLVSGVKQIKLSLQHANDKLSNDQFKTVKMIFEKSLCVNKAMKSGDIISFEDLEAKKPAGYGLDAKDFQQLIGKRVITNLDQWAFLTADVVAL